MALLPQLEALYKKWHKDGFEIVGINLDDKAETGQKRFKTLGITYSQVWVPSDENTRQLWQEASGMGSVPHLLLIDRDGVLRADGHIEDLEMTVAALMKKSNGTLAK